MKYFKNLYYRFTFNETDITKKVYIIAEIGHNHQGNLETAFELFRQAKLAGADAVKLQKGIIKVYIPNHSSMKNMIMKIVMEKPMGSIENI